MMYNPDHFDEGPIDPKSGFPSITPKPDFEQFTPMQTPMPGFGGGRMSNPLGGLQFALMNLANQDSQQSNNQKVIDTMSGITSLVNEAFPSFSQKYGGGIGTGMGSGGMGPYQPYGGRGGILSFGVPDPVNDPIKYPDNPLNAGTFDQSKFLDALGSLTGSTTQQPIQATKVSSMPSVLPGMFGGGIGGMLGSLM